MSRGIDFEKAEAALKRAGRRALHGTREERSGRPVLSAPDEIKYDPQSHVLRIRFGNGTSYDYFDVPQSVYEELVRVQSKVTFLNLHIKPKYAYRSVV